MQARKRINYLKAKHIEKRLMAIPNSGYEAEEDPTEQPSMAPALPPTFDIDDTSHLYRAYEPNPNNPGWITRSAFRSSVPTMPPPPPPPAAPCPPPFKIHRLHLSGTSCTACKA